MGEIIYRRLQPGEEKAFWKMKNALDNETQFMMYEPGEREEVEIDSIANLIESAQKGIDFLIVAEVDQQMVGYLSAERGRLNRIKHTAYIVTGIREGFRGKGIGTMFFTKLDEWARKQNVIRLELTVMRENTAAKGLYEKSGFVVEGIRKHAMYVEDEYRDEFYMAKLI